MWSILQKEGGLIFSPRAFSLLSSVQVMKLCVSTPTNQTKAWKATMFSRTEGIRALGSRGQINTCKTERVSIAYALKLLKGCGLSDDHMGIAYAEFWPTNLWGLRVVWGGAKQTILLHKMFIFLFCSSGHWNFGNGPNTVSGEYGFKHRTQWVFRGSLSSRERAQWVPLSLLFVCQSELTEFVAELTEFATELSEAQWVLFSETVLSKQYSARYISCKIGRDSPDVAFSRLAQLKHKSLGTPLRGLLGEPRGGLCPSDGDPQELLKSSGLHRYWSIECSSLCIFKGQKNQ